MDRWFSSSCAAFLLPILSNCGIQEAVTLRPYLLLATIGSRGASAIGGAASFPAVIRRVGRHHKNATGETPHIHLIVRRGCGVGGPHFDGGVHLDQLPPEGLADVVDVTGMILAEAMAIDNPCERLQDSYAQRYDADNT
jgi:hypothetical protein